MRMLTLNEQGLVAGGMMAIEHSGDGGGCFSDGGYGGSYSFSGGGGGGGGGGGYSSGLPEVPVDTTIDIGDLDTSLSFNISEGQPTLASVTVDDSSVETPVMSSGLANAIGSIAQAACGQYAKKSRRANGLRWLGYYN